MRLKSVLPDLVILALVIPAVILIFRLIPDRRSAALMAGTLFVMVPLGLMLRRWRQPLNGRAAQACWWGGVLFFWVIFALPILGMRLLYWELPFEEIVFLGIPGPVWHRSANSGFLVMMGLIAAGGWLSAGRRTSRA